MTQGGELKAAGGCDWPPGDGTDPPLALAGMLCDGCRRGTRRCGRGRADGFRLRVESQTARRSGRGGRGREVFILVLGQSRRG